MFLEFYAVGWKFLSFISIFAMFIQIGILIVLRAHYTMDIIASYVFGHYFWILSDKYSYLIDWKLLKIPLGKRMSTYSSDITEEENHEDYMNQLNKLNDLSSENEYNNGPEEGNHRKIEYLTT
jgi:hypothetical protein